MFTLEGQQDIVPPALSTICRTESPQFAERNLHRLASVIDISRMPGPSFMMVLTAAGSYAYRRADGIYVVPVGCLTY